MRNPKLSTSRRVEAIERSWADAGTGAVDKAAVREDLKTIAWGTAFPTEMRMAALEALLGDSDHRFDDDTRGMVRLMLPREPDPQVVRELSEAAASRGWAEVTPALVRSLSRPWSGVSDRQRPEYKALARLNPGTEVPLVVYGVFLHPPEEEPAFGVVPAERVRSDAWDLLARLDTGGELRSRLISEGADESGPIVDMRAALNELRTLPLTGDELRWLASLRTTSPQHSAWWDETRRAVSRLDGPRSTKLQLRHMEPIRWASQHRPDWVAMGRDELLREVRSRLEDRPVYRRSRRERDRIPPSPERLSDWERTLSWADLLAILVVDDALADAALRRALFAQAAMDRDDTSAEYGGVLRLEASSPGEPGQFVVVLYPPRPGSRRGDRQFVASTDMIAQSDHAVAHYHFHAQTVRNSDYAGPSPNDLAYAARYGRTCLVFTAVGDGLLNADLYQPDGVVLDLGVVQAP